MRMADTSPAGAISARNLRLAVFCYDFPHKKTQDVLWRLWIEGFGVDCVLAAERRDLVQAPSSLRVKPRHVDLVHPRMIAERLGAPYHVLSHSSERAAEIIRNHGVDLGVIGGARILRGDVLDAPSLGILNLHPGLIPEVRGLDALKWAILTDAPLGVTAHLIDERVDAGRILLRERIGLKADDTLVDVWLRLHETEIEILPRAIESLSARGVETFDLVGESETRSRVPPALDKEVIRKFRNRLERLRDSEKVASAQ